METRKLGNMGEELTTIGLGTWAIGGGGWDFGWGVQDDAESIATIRRALDLGINWIDTAHVYGFGRSEEVVGRAIEGRRDEVFLATKCGLVREEGSTTPLARLKEASIREEVEGSLRRLRVDTIDLYQIHWPDPEEEIEEAWATVVSLIQEGKVRYGGVSNFSVEQLERIRPHHPIASLQPPYSMLARGVEDDLLAYCAKHGIGVIGYSPMAVGILTDKMSREWFESLAPDDWRCKAKSFQEPKLSANLNLVEKLRELARKNDRPVAHLAIAWVLRRPEITAAIVGARRPSQIEETCRAAGWGLSDPILSEVERLLEERERTLTA